MKLNRRRFLQGMGYSVALPYLEAFASRAWAQTAAPLRTGVLYFPHGIPSMAAWRPQNQGALTSALPMNLRGLQPIFRDVTIIGGLQNKSNDLHDNGGAHATSAGSILCGTMTNIGGSRSDFSASLNAETFDQSLGRQLFSDRNTLRALALATPCDEVEGGMSYNYPYCGYISYKGPRQAAEKFENPRDVYNLLVSAIGSPTQQPASQTVDRRKSVIDFVLNDAKSLHSKLGSADRSVLDQYLTNLRSVEQSLSRQPSSNSCSAGTAPASEALTTANFVKNMDTLLDLLVLALQCDLTRVFTYQLCMSFSGQSYRGAIPGANSVGYHSSSHWNENGKNDQTALTQYKTLTQFFCDKGAAFLNRLAQIQEPNGMSLLQNSMILLMSDADEQPSVTHSGRNLPVVLAGRGGGSINAGRYFESGGRPICNLYLSLMKRMGLNINQFGDSNGTIAL